LKLRKGNQQSVNDQEGGLFEDAKKKDQGSLFSRAENEPLAAVSKVELDALAARIKRNWRGGGVDIRTVETFADLPKSIQQQAREEGIDPREIQGVFHASTGSIYVVRDNIPSIKAAGNAKQADDDTLRQMADRIQARAIRRAGELLKQFDGRGRPPENNHGAGVIFSQAKAAADAGMSRRQKETAVRVANVPAETFERAVEAEKPAAVTPRLPCLAPPQEWAAPRDRRAHAMSKSRACRRARLRSPPVAIRPGRRTRRHAREGRGLRRA